MRFRHLRRAESVNDGCRESANFQDSASLGPKLHKLFIVPRRNKKCGRAAMAGDFNRLFTRFVLISGKVSDEVGRRNGGHFNLHSSCVKYIKYAKVQGSEVRDADAQLLGESRLTEPT